MGNNIIVIDDDVGTALFFKICLEDQGYQVNIYNDPNAYWKCKYILVGMTINKIFYNGK